MSASKRYVDWEAIERDYRAGIKTLRHIAAEHSGLSHQAIAKRAKSAGWDRDLKAKIQARADALVDKSAVDKKVDRERLSTERVLIEANAAAIASIRLAHRSSIGRARGIVDRLFSELEEQHEGATDLLDKARIVKTLTDSLRTAVELERTAFGMDSADAAAGAGEGVSVSVTYRTAAAEGADSDG